MCALAPLPRAEIITYDGTGELIFAVLHLSKVGKTTP